MPKTMMLKLFLLLSLLLGNIAANTIEDAKKLFDDQKYEEAIQIFNANDHDGEAQYYLGKSYYYGLGVKKDLKKAYYHTHQSSINKNPSGINLLGVMYQYGEGVEKDEVRAFSLYTEAANLGSPKAMANIGMLFYSDNDSIKNDYVQSYEYILNATQQGEFGNTVFMYEMVSKKLVSQDKYNESIYWLKKAADPLVNKTNSLSKAQYVLYSYYQKTNQSPQAIELATSAYSNGDILLGCMLSFDYKNENTIESFKKAHFIASEVISSNPKIYEATRCAYTLADLYIQGNYVAKDINKAITTLETAFNKYDNLDHITAAWIAKLYFNILNDELNGTKWYQIAYDLSNNFSYLNEITRYKKRFSHINDDNLTTLNHKQLYPLLYNFIKPTQIMSGLESKKYFFFATDQKSIKIYNKRSLTLFNELRGEVGNGIDGVTIGMAFDENSELLYCSSILNKYDQNANAIIRVYNINSGKIVKTLKDAPSFVGSELDISDDGIYLLSFNTSSEIKLINTITHQLQEYKLLGKKLTNGKIRKEGDDYYAYILTDHNLLYKFSVNNKILISVEPFLNQIVFKTLDVENAKNIFINNNSDITKIILKNKQIHLQKNTSRNFITFDLNDFSINSDAGNIIDSAASKLNITLNLTNQNSTLETYMNNQKITTIEFGSESNISAKNINDKYIVVATNDTATMYILNFQGKAIANLEGFSTVQKNIIYNKNYLITYGDDDVIHVWSIDQINRLGDVKNDIDKNKLSILNKYTGYNMLEIFGTEKFDDLLDFFHNPSNSLNFPVKVDQSTDQIKA